MATIENRKQVVTQTLWTRPEANIATTRQRITSGNNLVWKFRPNIEVSKFPTAVRRKTKSCDPINPPRIVIHSLDAKFVLNICIPAKVNTVNVDANRNDVYDGRAMLKRLSLLTRPRLRPRDPALEATSSPTSLGWHCRWPCCSAPSLQAPFHPSGSSSGNECPSGPRSFPLGRNA